MARGGAGAGRRGASTSAELASRHLLTLNHKTPEQLQSLLRLSAQLKDRLRGCGHRGRRAAPYTPLQGRSVAMIFQKRSTRTRVSTETATALLGGHALFLGRDDIQLGASESVRDTARVLSRFNDVILARVYGHEDVEELARSSCVPVINALSDRYHPLQILADLQTLQERFGSADLSGLRLAWVGDGNNVLHSYMAACPKLGIHLRAALPVGYDSPPEIVQSWKAEADRAGVEAVVTRDPQEAVAGAHCVVTDTWVSMGQEEEKQQRLKAFAGYQVTERMCAPADKNWVFLHCLPRYSYEVDDEVFEGPRSLVFDAAENRMWTVAAVLHDQLVGSEMEE